MPSVRAARFGRPRSGHAMPTPMPGDDLAVAVSALALWRMGGCSAGSSSCSRAILQGGMAGGPASIGPPGLSPEVEGGRRRAALSSLRHCAWPAGGGSPAVPRDLRVSEHWNLEPRLEASRALRLGIGLGRAARGLRSSLFRGRRRPVRCMFQRTAHRKPTQRPFNEVVQGLKVLPIVLPAAHVKHPVSRGRCWICCRLRRSSLQGP